MKVLIISHNPVSEQSNMGKTFMTLFSQFRQEELCQLYIYPTVPNAQYCRSYYRVTDKQAVKAVLSRKPIGGEVVAEPSQTAYEKAGDEALYRNKKNKSALRRLARDAVWQCAPWYNEKLKTWLDRQAPTCIFVAPGVAKFIYDFALRISRERKIPIVTYVCDEYYFVKRPESALDRLRLRLLKKKIRQLMTQTDRLVAISRELEENYGKEFGLPVEVIMTGGAVESAREEQLAQAPDAICYFGNVRSNRYISLGQIGKALDEMNREKGTSYRLKIYTSEKDQQILEHLRQFSSVELCGFVTGAEFTETLSRAPLLLHTEAFDEESIDRVRNSVSTKIADSLASGIALLAYGPEEVSSMKHLIRNGCALTAVSPEELPRMLETAFTDANARQAVVKNALDTARQYHDSAKNSCRLYRVLQEVSENTKDK